MISYGRQSINKKDINEVVKVLKSNFLTQGPMIEKFEKRLKKYFKSLKNDGIIHYSINSIISEILRFKKNPKNWMRDKSKKQSIKNFIIKFCNIDEKWNHSWIKFLYKI